MSENLKFIKRVTKHTLKNKFDETYDMIRQIAKDKFDYDGEIRVIKNKKWISFYIINEDLD